MKTNIIKVLTKQVGTHMLFWISFEMMNGTNFAYTYVFLALKTVQLSFKKLVKLGNKNSCKHIFQNLCKQNPVENRSLAKLNKCVQTYTKKPFVNWWLCFVKSLQFSSNYMHLFAGLNDLLNNCTTLIYLPYLWKYKI